MSILIIVFGLLMLLAGMSLITNPEIIIRVLRENADKLWLHIGAVGVRLTLGAVLIYQASVSNFPVIMEVIGWIAIFAAIVFTIMGRNNFKRLISWVFSLVEPFGRIGGVLAICFGSFLIYAFV
ncbi:hypothetical protein L2755_10010 [Shewanella abyssi]|uniref:hypothetical protein n=1 Tax=Shewanella abyssi TaxID=311789 RepID=UPI00200BAE9D|nr:hypothetical protein [Shewanella abyssi]MCL1049955.1 hypothetical protein [Shewanella abyssi]